MLGIVSVFAQLERETILQRTRMGLKKRAEDGYWRGGGKTPFAYDYDKETGMLVVNKENKAMFDLMKTMRLEGYSYHQLSEITGYDESWIQGILKSKTNLGKIPYKDKVYDGKHEPIITEEEYEQLQQIENGIYAITDEGIKDLQILYFSYNQMFSYEAVLFYDQKEDFLHLIPLFP